MICRILSFLVLVFLVEQSVFCIEDSKTANSTEDYKINFLLPINWTSSPRYNLKITIPEGYRPLQPESAWGEDSTSIIEFIPKGESQDNWSEIITIHKLIGKKINAAMMIDTLKSSILSQTKNGKIWKGSLTRKDAYLFGSLGLSYDLNGRHEILGCRYYSGPYDCVGIQYTLRPVKGFHDEDMEKKIENFFNTLTEIITTSVNEESQAVADIH